MLVDTDIVTRAEKQLVEGDTFDPAPAPPKKVIEPLPGFVPETLEEEKAPTPAARRTFRMVEVPELKAVRVNINFDEVLAQATVTRAKYLVRAYLQANYQGKAVLSFGMMPMLKPEKEIAFSL